MDVDKPLYTTRQFEELEAENERLRAFSDEKVRENEQLKEAFQALRMKDYMTVIGENNQLRKAIEEALDYLKDRAYANKELTILYINEKEFTTILKKALEGGKEGKE